MPSAHINPQKLKNSLLDAVDIGKEGASTAPLPLVALTVNESGAQAYGRSTYCVGWSYTEAPIDANTENTVFIEFDEAKELAQVIGKTSAAKDATVWVEISDDHLMVNYGNESLAALPSVEAGEGDIDAINDELDTLGQAEATERTHFAMGLETIKRFTKVRDKTQYMDLMFTSIGNTTFVKIGDTFIGGFEAIARDRVVDPKLFMKEETHATSAHQGP
ncbi:MAG: hypothetical protein ACTIC1_05740 [Brevibacterium sp.]|uniref:hypothetical protein n=1 Tax=Brevibacterium aurantiacum TaxID=273384 RepID=UPI003F903AEC